MYYGLPQKEWEASLLSFRGFDKPKSAILICPSIPISKFSGFRSLYTMFLDYKSSTSSECNQDKRESTGNKTLPHALSSVWPFLIDRTVLRLDNLKLTQNYIQWQGQSGSSFQRKTITLWRMGNWNPPKWISRSPRSPIVRNPKWSSCWSVSSHSVCYRSSLELSTLWKNLRFPDTWWTWNRSVTPFGLLKTI